MGWLKRRKERKQQIPSTIDILVPEEKVVVQPGVVELELILDMFDQWGFRYTFGYNLNRDKGDQNSFMIFDEYIDHLWYGSSRLDVARKALEEVKTWEQKLPTPQEQKSNS